MLNDAWLDLYDQAVLISNDSDLEMAMQMVSTTYKGKPEKITGLCSDRPRKRKPGGLSKFAHWYKGIQKENLETSQLPDKISENIFKPEVWNYTNHREGGDKSLPRNDKATQI